MPAVVAHPEVELVALVDADQEWGQALRASHGLARKVFSDIRPLAGVVDAVINALPNHLYTPVNLCFLEHRVHVLCAKPLATSSADARLSYDAAKRHGVLLVTALHWRLYQSTRLPRLTLDEGIIGYKARVPFRQGLDLTEQWLPWANYL